MKYLKFYEAFKSKGVSNTLKFLKDKVGKNSSGKFLEYLKLMPYDTRIAFQRNRRI